MRARLLIDSSLQITTDIELSPEEYHSQEFKPGMASRNLLSRLPLWISHWLGYRKSLPLAPPAPIFIYFWSFIGAFIGISIIQAIFEQSSYFQARHVPTIVASYVRSTTLSAFEHRLFPLSLPFLLTYLRLTQRQGASAVLCYGNIDVPLAQPRALLGGHFLSALTGVCITKLFHLLPSHARFESLRWLAGSLSVATAIIVMQFTKTTHPPAGATALLAAVDDVVLALGWYYLPVVLLSSTMVLVSALLVNNIQRRYPVFWWEPVKPAQVEALKAKELPSDSTDKVEENAASSGSSVSEV